MTEKLLTGSKRQAFIVYKNSWMKYINSEPNPADLDLQCLIS